LPEYQRVRDYVIRAERLPRTTARKVKRFELKNQIEGSGEIAWWERDVTSRGFYGHRVKLDLWERSSGVASQG
jgi:hypothetical protein